MGPIAKKILAGLRRARSRDVVDLAAVREARAMVEQTTADHDALPPAHRAWMAQLSVLSRFSFSLLGLRELRKLGERFDLSEERYMPGGPPMSPLTSSFHTLWMVADATIGLKRETLASIAVDVARALGTAGETLAPWDILASSYPGLYLMTARDGALVDLEELVTGERARVEIADDVGGDPGCVWWTRLLPPVTRGGYWSSVVTPYVYVEPGADDAWRAYLARTLGNAPTPQAYRQLMKRGPAQPFGWFDYILDAYVGTLRHSVALAGVPDRPETLPHSEQGEALREQQRTPLDRVRDALSALARAHRLDRLAAADFELARSGTTGGPEREASPQEAMLEQRYAWYAARDDNGKTALDMLHTDELDAGDRPIVEHLRAGWFSVFEVTRVRIDHGLELRDILREHTLFVRERAGSRQVALGDLLAGWVLVDGDDITFEGVLAHAPKLLASRAKHELGLAMSRARQTMRLPWRELHAAMVPVVATILSELRSQPPDLDLRNNEGHEIVIGEAVYDVVDHARTAAALRAIPLLEETGDAPDRDHFVWVDPILDVLVAEVVLREERLTVQTNSRERLEHVRSTIERAAGDAIVHRADSFADPLSSARAGQPPREPAAPPPEVREAMLQEVQRRLEAWLDTPVPALGNQTPRSKTRTDRGRDDVAAMLMEQEQMLQRNGLADGLQFAPLWEQLGLRYPGPFAG